LLKTVLYPEAGRSTAFSFGRWCSFILKIFLLKFEKLNGILLFFSSSSGANIPQWAPTHFMGHFAEVRWKLEEYSPPVTFNEKRNSLFTFMLFFFSLSVRYTHTRKTLHDECDETQKPSYFLSLFNLLLLNI